MVSVSLLLVARWLLWKVGRLLLDYSYRLLWRLRSQLMLWWVRITLASSTLECRLKPLFLKQSWLWLVSCCAWISNCLHYVRMAGSVVESCRAYSHLSDWHFIWVVTSNWERCEFAHWHLPCLLSYAWSLYQHRLTWYDIEIVLSSCRWHLSLV